jgi:hypothetical protein
MVDMKDEFIPLPADMDLLLQVSKDHEAVGLPGCVGSMDVVHVKWSNCPMGNHNHLKGKEGYPSLAFQCIADYN